MGEVVGRRGTSPAVRAKAGCIVTVHPSSIDEARRDDADGILTVTFTRERKLNAVSDHGRRLG